MLLRIQPQIQLQTTATEHEMMIIGPYAPLSTTTDVGAPRSLVITFAIT